MPDVSQELLIRSLDTAVAETLEMMFFSDALPAADARLSDATIRSVVRFSGDAYGRLELGLATADARELTSNFLGIDEMAVGTIQIESVCGEMANMICGAVLSSTLPEGRFHLGHADIVPVSELPEPYPLCRNYMTGAGTIAVSMHYLPLECPN